MKSVKYAVDRIEENAIVLESLSDNKIRIINIKEVNYEVKEKDILIFKNGKYYKDENEKANRLKLLQEKLNRVKNIK